MHRIAAMAKYWAGQKLLHSPLHPYYLKLAGKEPKPQTYDEWLAAELVAFPERETPHTPDLAAHGYRLVVAAGVRTAPTAASVLLACALETDADLVYADEDCMDAAGRRHSPVFRPGWSPVLFAGCPGYIGDSYLIREGVDAPHRAMRAARLPRVLFHRDSPASYVTSQDPGLPKYRGKVSVIICSRNERLLKDCLGALRTQTEWPFEAIVVDHISGTNSGMTQLIAAFGAKRVEYRDDFHFGRMCQAGVERSESEFVLFLNDDTAPLTKDWLTRMLAQAERPGTGAVGALLYYPDGRIQHAGVLVGTPNGGGHPGRLTSGTPAWPWLQTTREQSAVTGACLLMRREIYESHQGFDPIFPVNYNDVDLCLRVRQSGLSVLIEASAKLTHFESTTRKTGIRYQERQLFLERWASVIEAGDEYFSPNLTDNELLLPDPECFATRASLKRLASRVKERP